MRILVLLLALLAPSMRPAAAQTALTLLPLPTEARYGQGRLLLKTSLKPLLPANADASVAAAVGRTLLRLHGPAKIAGPATLQIRYGRVGRAEKFDEERYSLRITPMGVTIDAPTSLGVLRALATLEQLPRTDKKGRYLPEVDIRDQPRFAWRGLSLDAARHFLPVAVVKRNLDAMAAVKLNVLHWHLTDDQGFRVESKTFPRLHTVGSTDGLFYTQAEVREVLAYAAARGIRVVPEFDVPSHTTSWIVAYPRLASNDSAYAPYRLWRTTNVAIDPTRETTYTFLDSLFTEMTALFPDPYFHVGGDENDGRNWRRTPRIVAWARAHHLTRADSLTLDKHRVQTYFNRRVLALLQARGKTMMGWDEILGPDLPQTAVIQSWRGKKGLNEAAKLGHPVLLSNGYYLDLNYSAAAAYAADPLPARLAPHARRAGSWCWAARRPCGPNSPIRWWSSRASGPAPGPWPSGCGRRAATAQRRARYVPPPEPGFGPARNPGAAPPPRSRAAAEAAGRSQQRGPAAQPGRSAGAREGIQAPLPGLLLHHRLPPQPPGGCRPGRVGSGPPLRRAGG